MQKAAYFDIHALTHLLRGKKQILNIIETYREFYTGSLTITQLIGAEEYLVEKKISKEVNLRGLLDSFIILDFTREDAEKAGEIMGKVKAENKDISINEAIVAAQCFRRGLTLITGNKTFVNLKNAVKIEIKQI